MCCKTMTSSTPLNLLMSDKGFSHSCHMKFFNFCNRSSEKRVSAVALSNDGLYVCFADKFGVVWVVDLNGLDRNQVSTNKKAAPLLAHYCSIITGLVRVANFLAFSVVFLRMRKIY